MAASTRSRGTFSPKNTTSGLSTPPQRRQDGTAKEEKSAPSRSASPSGASVASRSSQPAFSRPSSSCSSSRGDLALAIHAADAIDPPVQVDDPRAAGRLMQPVHVLGQKKLDSARRFEPGQSAMRVVRPGLTNAPPADEAARPIAPARLLLAHEGLIGHRLRAVSIGRRRRDSRECPNSCCSPRRSG